MTWVVLYPLSPIHPFAPYSGTLSSRKLLWLPRMDSSFFCVTAVPLLCWPYSGVQMSLSACPSAFPVSSWMAASPVPAQGLATPWVLGNVCWIPRVPWLPRSCPHLLRVWWCWASRGRGYSGPSTAVTWGNPWPRRTWRLLGEGIRRSREPSIQAWVTPPPCSLELWVMATSSK